MLLRIPFLALGLTAALLAGCATPEPDEVSVRIIEKTDYWSDVVNAVVVISAEKDNVAIKTLLINGGQCPILYKDHKPVLNIGQQNTYTLSQRCRFHDVTHVEVGTEHRTSTFTFGG